MIRPLTAMWIVLTKEVGENLRDRRTVVNALIVGPLLMPVLFALMFNLVVGKELERMEQPIQVVILGQEHAPNLLRYLAEREVTPKQNAPADPEAAIRNQNEDAIIRITPEFADDWRAGRPASVELLHDSTRRFSSTTVRRIEGLLRAYGDTVGRLRLIARGIHPEVIQPLRVVERDLSTPKNRAAVILMMLPYLLIIGAFTGGMYLAIDTTAGERERQSLEPLLINAVPRAAILAGKLAATTTFAILSLTLTLIAFSIVFPLIHVERLGIELRLDAKTVLLLLACIAPLAFFASALQTLIAAFSKSFREVQTWLGLFLLLPMIPSLVLMLNPTKPAAWMYATPLVSQQTVINQLTRGESVLTWQYLASIGVTFVAGVVVALLAVRVYHSERLAVSA